MIRTTILLACFGLAACSKSDDKERWSAAPPGDKSAPAPAQPPAATATDPHAGHAQPPPAAPAAPPAAPAGSGGVRHISIEVTDEGFVPTPIAVKANQPLMLMITRKTDKTCAKEIVIPDYKIEKQLPLNKMVEVSFTPKKTGELVYGCAMDQMIRGVLTVQ